MIYKFKVKAWNYKKTVNLQPNILTNCNDKTNSVFEETNRKNH